MRKKVDHVNKSDAAAADPPALQLLEALHALMHELRAQQQRDPGIEALGLTTMEAKVLGFFARQPGATASELAAHSGRDKGQLARLVAGLRERGLLDAVLDAQDGRVVRLHPGRAAQQLHAAVQRRRQALAEQALAPLDAAERRRLLDLLQRMQQAIGSQVFTKGGDSGGSGTGRRQNQKKDVRDE